jgi:hypothetical protein
MDGYLDCYTYSKEGGGVTGMIRKFAISPGLPKRSMKHVDICSDKYSSMLIFTYDPGKYTCSYDKFRQVMFPY